MQNPKLKKEIKKDLIAIRNGAMITPILYKLLSLIQKERAKLLGEIKLEEGIKWMQEGSNKNRKGFTNGYNEAVSDLEKLKSNLLKDKEL